MRCNCIELDVNLSEAVEQSMHSVSDPATCQPQLRSMVACDAGGKGLLAAAPPDEDEDFFMKSVSRGAQDLWMPRRLEGSFTFHVSVYIPALACFAAFCNFNYIFHAPLGPAGPVRPLAAIIRTPTAVSPLQFIPFSRTS